MHLFTDKGETRVKFVKPEAKAWDLVCETLVHLSRNFPKDAELMEALDVLNVVATRYIGPDSTLLSPKATPVTAPETEEDAPDAV